MIEIGAAMQVSVTEAKEVLTDLVQRAEAGEEIVLTRNGHAAVRLVPVSTARDAHHRRALLASVRASAAGKAMAEPGSARSQDFLYDGDGFPA